MGQLKDGTSSREEDAADLRRLFPERNLHNLPSIDNLIFCELISFFFIDSKKTSNII